MLPANIEWLWHHKAVQFDIGVLRSLSLFASYSIVEGLQSDFSGVPLKLIEGLHCNCDYTA